MQPDQRVAELAGRLRGRLVAAAATPTDGGGRVDAAVVDAYLAGLVADGAGGLAVCAHTGRGPYLDPTTRDLLVRRARSLDVPVVVGVGGPGDTPAATLAAAELAAAGGADALLVFPSPDPLDRHDALWRATGLPLVAFDLYTAPYQDTDLHALLAHPGVAGVKTARLHDAIACQAALAAARDAGRLAITGEDRMFGPSLMWGADAALVGIAAAAVPLTAGVLDAHVAGRFDEFVVASRRLDALASVTFRPPYDGYVQRMLWIAAAEQRIPPDHAGDAHGPDLDPAERSDVLTTWRTLAETRV
ncbi:dihydrodipicolinate synthase family protein [Actinophytocola gossypii]|uniref:Dihydrodipicolinate synthase family protein n=1 Tax=Actinophytocola gossypii TaxID=2812003 RepID=A0ABT2J5H3_9PSEU|nr:dihydrodipicolinate synthase family protein [Actinophytocola gossypii]MCT2583109.1 dihydrodipicolinate synthase family protein [Actinophytocola gossypii]